MSFRRDSRREPPRWQRRLRNQRKKGGDYLSIFDQPNEDKLSDDYPEGTPFMLYSAEYEGVKNTSFGPGHQATVLVGPEDRSGENKEYRVFGRLAEQVKKLDAGELPARVKIIREGRAFSWAKAETSQEIPF